MDRVLVLNEGGDAVDKLDLHTLLVLDLLVGRGVVYLFVYCHDDVGHLYLVLIVYDRGVVVEEYLVGCGEVVVVVIHCLSGLCDVREGILNNCIKKHNKRQLNEKRETTGKRAVAFLLLEVHDLLLLLLHGGLISSTLVFSLDLLDLGSELRHSYLILLLLDREGEKYDFEYQRIEQKRQCVTAGKAFKEGKHRTEESVKPI